MKKRLRSPLRVRGSEKVPLSSNTLRETILSAKTQSRRKSMVVEILNEWLSQNDVYSMTEMAERIGVTKSANCFMSQVRSGRSKMPIRRVLPLASLLQQDPKPLVAAIIDEYYPDLKAAMIESGLIKDYFDKT
jgi:hypothetical protein